MSGFVFNLRTFFSSAKTFRIFRGCLPFNHTFDCFYWCFHICGQIFTVLWIWDAGLFLWYGYLDCISCSWLLVLTWLSLVCFTKISGTLYYMWRNVHDSWVVTLCLKIYSYYFLIAAPFKIVTYFTKESQFIQNVLRISQDLLTGILAFSCIMHFGYSLTKTKKKKENRVVFVYRKPKERCKVGLLRQRQARP